MTHGASQNKDEKWASWTCVIGWPVQGIWPPCSDGSDINSVDRNNVRDIIATADDFGKVKLFKFPCAKEHSSKNKFWFFLYINIFEILINIRDIQPMLQLSDLLQIILT